MYDEINICCDYKYKWFVESCIQSTQFRKFIGCQIEAYNADWNVYIKNECVLGMFNAIIDETTGIRIAYPIIYLTTNDSLDSFRCFAELVEFLFVKQKVDKIQVVVYSNNTRMLLMMRKSSFYEEGCLERAKVVDGGWVSIYYFSMNKDEFQRKYLKRKI